MALLQKMTCNLRHPASLCHPVFRTRLFYRAVASDHFIDYVSFVSGDHFIDYVSLWRHIKSLLYKRRARNTGIFYRDDFYRERERERETHTHTHTHTHTQYHTHIHTHTHTHTPKDFYRDVLICHVCL